MEEKKTSTAVAIILTIILSAIPIFILCALYYENGQISANNQTRQQICKQVYTNTNDYINCSHRPIEETIKLLKPIK